MARGRDSADEQAPGVLRALVWRRVRGWRARRLRAVWPPLGLARFGAMWRLRPVSDNWGYERGLPLDRWYIEHFLGRFAAFDAYAEGDVRGRVLEVGGDAYARRFARGPTTTIDVLHVSDVNPAATIIGDLVTGRGVPNGQFDCIICTQTLHIVYDIHAAVRTLHRALAPGGVVFATVPGITPSCWPDRDHWGDWWRLTTPSAQRLFAEAFGADDVHVEAYGNLLTAMGFLQGLAAEEFSERELTLRDPSYEVLIAIRAQRPRDGL